MSTFYVIISTVLKINFRNDFSNTSKEIIWCSFYMNIFKRRLFENKKFAFHEIKSIKQRFYRTHEIEFSWFFFHQTITIHNFGRQISIANDAFNQQSFRQNYRQYNESIRRIYLGSLYINILFDTLTSVSIILTFVSVTLTPVNLISIKVNVCTNIFLNRNKQLKIFFIFFHVFFFHFYFIYHFSTCLLPFFSNDEYYFTLQSFLCQINEYAGRKKYVVILFRTKKIREKLHKKIWIICDRDRKMRTFRKQQKRYIISKHV